MFKRLLNKFKKKKPYDASQVARELGVRVGENCRIFDNPRSIFGSEPWLVKLGNNIAIAQGVRFLCHDGGVSCLRNMNPEKYADKDFFAPIVVGDNVFIGMYTLIMPGVTIGDNCIIGAHSVVTKDVPSNTVVAGVPARQIKTIQEYEEKVCARGVVPTKNMSIEEKRKYLQENFPGWFE